MSTKFASNNDTRGTVQILTGTHLFDGVEPEAASEDAQSREQLLLIRSEKVVRPLHQILHGAVTGNHRRLRAGQEIETLVETFSECGGTHGPDARRREFDRKGKAVEVADDLDDVTHIVRSEREPGTGRDGAFDEETRGRSLRCDRRTGAFIGNREWSNAPYLLARESEHFPARGEDGHTGTPVEESLGERRDGAAQVLAVVEDQQRAPRSQIFDKGVLDGEMLALLHIDRCGDGADRRCRIAHRCEFCHEDLAVELVPQLTCEPQAIRVLPTPPGPVSVTSRSVCSRAMSSSSSSDRPTSPVDSAGTCRMTDRRDATGG